MLWLIQSNFWTSSQKTKQVNLESWGQRELWEGLEASGHNSCQDLLQGQTQQGITTGKRWFKPFTILGILAYFFPQQGSMFRLPLVQSLLSVSTSQETVEKHNIYYSSTITYILFLSIHMNLNQAVIAQGPLFTLSFCQCKSGSTGSHSNTDFRLKWEQSFKPKWFLPYTSRITRSCRDY